eukprot:scaffold8262_cov267-Pinguiococcus_pyrenoidosus.AAC.4
MAWRVSLFCRAWQFKRRYPGLVHGALPEEEEAQTGCFSRRAPRRGGVSPAAPQGQAGQNLPAAQAHPADEEWSGERRAGALHGAPEEAAAARPAGKRPHVAGPERRRARQAARGGRRSGVPAKRRGCGAADEAPEGAGMSACSRGEAP